jgi:hypothetical protein
MTHIAVLTILPFIHYFLQTLTTLELSSNRIGPQGAEYLAKALEQNKVKLLLPLCFPFSR